ncbi:hypothetical protein NMY22_g16648 [Coprinellus aureogranulatus]|nr:hypothetical protein NMY22_g16648 [Coprinellus aureogranulatus]
MTILQDLGDMAHLSLVASSEYDFGEDSIDDAILAFGDPTAGCEARTEEFASHVSSDYDMGDESIDDAILALEERCSHLPTPPPSTQARSPRGRSENSFGGLQSSPLASGSGTRLSSGPLKRKAEDDADFALMEPPRQRLHETTPTPAVVCPVSPSGLMTSMCSHLPYGAQFELARYVGNRRLKYEELDLAKVMKLKELATNVTAIPLLEDMLTRGGMLTDGIQGALVQDDRFYALFEKERRARDPWEELDKEEAALARSPYGCMGYEDNGAPSQWYGGRVQFRGTLILQDSTKDLHLKLERPSLGPSTQLTRRFGSRQLFRMKVPEASRVARLGQELVEYCKRPIVLCGSVYRAFYVKEDTVFFIKTNEVWNSARTHLTDNCRDAGFSLVEFLRWFNPPVLNGNQARFRPVKKNIKFINDIVNPVTRANMTDGAGTMNRALRRMFERHQTKQDAYAVQVRVHGAKGLLVEDVYDLADEPTLSITPSQIKVKYPPEDEDPSHIAIDLLRTSHIRVGTRISAELLVNLSDNGVPLSAFSTLLKTSFENHVAHYLDWSNDKESLLRLRKFIATDKAVLQARLARENPGTARVMGYNERDACENDVDDGEQLGDTADSSQRSSRWWPDPVSGQPASLSETIVGLLDSGFSPQTCAVLREKLRMSVVDAVRREKETVRVEVPLSAIAFLEPDRGGYLKEDEISVRSSRCIFKRPDGTMTTILEGDVLVARYPCKLPTDVRKLRAVNIPLLDSKRDTIVLSTQGPRRAADWLSGGDYDGDKAVVIWQPELVDPFRNAPDFYADPPEDMSRYFEKDIEKASEVFDLIEGLTEADAISEIQNHLLAPLAKRTDVGVYSTWHERAVYQLGYRHPTTRRLAFMFCMVMDAPKSGLAVKKHVYERDMKLFNVAPAWKGSSGPFNETNMCSLKRSAHLGSFVMDDLLKLAKDQGDIQLARIEGHFNSFSDVEDAVLSGPFKEILSKAASPRIGPFYREDLERIHNHVQEEYWRWHESIYTGFAHPTTGSSPCKKSKKRKGKIRESDAAFTNRDIEDRQDILRAASRRFASGPDPESMLMTAEAIARVKASYAYLYDAYRKEFGKKEITLDEMIKKVQSTTSTSRVSWSRFPWDVAFRDLCELKAKSRGDFKPVAQAYYERMTLKLPS